MEKLIDVLRRPAPGEPAFHQAFTYRMQDAGTTLATALREINQRSDLRDVHGEQAAPIRWECSCLQRKCGSCAMLVEGVPRLACDTRLAQLRGEVVHVEPLRKFRVVADLVVDRSALFTRLAEIGVWLEQSVELPQRRSGVAYEASRCLQCGCCLEVCPNFSTAGPFAGMAGMVPLSRLLAELPRGRRDRLVGKYRAHVYAGCGKSLACRDICPAEIPIDALMARSNAAAVWGR